jgi:hypothetical protein
VGRSRRTPGWTVQAVRRAASGVDMRVLRPLTEQVTVADLLAADSPRPLLQQAGFTVTGWVDEGSGALAAVHVPGVGWLGCFFGVVYRWDLDPLRRMEMLLDGLLEPLCPPAADLAALAVALLAAQRPPDPLRLPPVAQAVASHAWLHGLLAAALLDQADEPQRDRLLALTDPAGLDGLHRLRCFRRQEPDELLRSAAEQVMAEQISRRWPHVDPCRCGEEHPPFSPRLSRGLNALLQFPVEQWPAQAPRLVDALQAEAAADPARR